MTRLLACILCLISLSTLAQGPTFKLKSSDWLVTGGSVALATGSTWLRLTSQGYDPLDMPKFNRLEINKFDRNATKNWDPKSALHSDILALSAQVLPTLIFLNQKGRNEYLTIGHIYAQSTLLTLSATDFTKTLIRRNRPYMYGDKAPMRDLMASSARFSFFSGHTSLTASQCFLTAKMFSEMYPDSPNKSLVWSGAIIYPAVVGYLRIRAGKHFPTDVIVGYLVGGLIGYLTPHFHLKRKNNE
jgi:hypothetical protein